MLPAYMPSKHKVAHICRMGAHLHDSARKAVQALSDLVKHGGGLVGGRAIILELVRLIKDSKMPLDLNEALYLQSAWNTHSECKLPLAATHK